MSLNLETFCDHAAHGRLAHVQRMLILQSDELLVNGDVCRALQRAAENGHVDVVNYLLRLRDACSDPSANDNLAILLASENGHLAVVQRLLQDRRVDPSAGDNEAIQGAAHFGHLAVVERLLRDKRVDPSADDNYAIRAAAENGHVAVVERLLRDKRVDPTADQYYAVRLAAQYDHLAVVDRLLEDDRVDAAVAIRHSRPEDLNRFECRERLTEICIALQAMQLPAWVTVKILRAARPWSTMPLHSKWSLVCKVKHFQDEEERVKSLDQLFD